MTSSDIGQILIVDDELELKNILVEALTAQGYAAAGFTSAGEALAVLRERPFDVLLTDLMMPGMDGIALLKEAIQIDPNLVCIMMTGQGTIQTAVDAMKVGAFDYVLKPFRLQTMLPVLTRAMNTRHLRLENVQLREAVAIHELTETIAFTLDPKTVLSKLADAALMQSEADEVSVLLPAEDGDHFYVAAVRGEKRERLLGERVPLGRSITSWVAREREPLMLNGEVDDERFVALWPRSEINSSVSIPMLVAQKLVGVLSLNAINRPRPFTLGQMKALTILAGTAAAALESASLYTQIENQRQRLDNIVANVPGMVWEAWGQPDAAEQRIDFVSDHVEVMLGYTVEEWLSTPNFWLKIVHPDDKEHTSKTAAEAFALGRDCTMEFRWLKKDGSAVWVESNFVVIKDDEGRSVGLRGVNTDISERKRAEAVEARRAVHTLFRADVSAALAGSKSSLQETLKLCAEAMVRHLNAAFARVWTFNDEASVLELQTSAGLYTHINGPHARVPLGSFKIGRIAEQRLPHISNDVPNDPEVSDKDWATREGMVAFAGYPLIIEDRLLGVMALFSREPLEDDTIEALASIADIVSQGIERQRAETALRESEERYRELFESNPYPMWVFDLETLRFLAVNDAAVSHYGYSRDEFLRLTIANIRPAEDVPQLMKDLSNEPAGGIRESRHCKKDGTVIDIEISSQRLIFAKRRAQLVLALDVTVRKKAEAALRESEEAYRDLVENAHDIIYSHDLEGNYTSVNKAGEVITGYTRAEALKLNLVDTVAPEWRDKAKDMMRRKLAGERVTAYEMELVAKDGRRVAVEVNTKLVYEDGKPLAVQGIARDVTERKLLEEQLRQSQKMEAIGQLAGGVAHDFNNLLTAINGYSSLALQRMDDDHPLRSFIEEVKKAGDRAANLTRQLLAFGRKQILQPVPVNLNDVVTDLNKMLRRLIGEDIRLAARLDLDLKKIKADPGQIEQVLMNLVVNARDAMPRGGNLTIETANVQIDEEYAGRHIGVNPGAYVMLAVSDNGTGMDDETKAKLFEPFFTTKEKGKGTGLGLSTVYGIVKQSGGNIWVYSEISHGTTFKVYLPQVDDSVQTVQAKIEEDFNPRGSETVLLVEDEEVVRGLARRILEEAGVSRDQRQWRRRGRHLVCKQCRDDPSAADGCGYARDQRQGACRTADFAPPANKSSIHVGLHRRGHCSSRSSGFECGIHPETLHPNGTLEKGSPRTR